LGEFEAGFRDVVWRGHHLIRHGCCWTSLWPARWGRRTTSQQNAQCHD
jgi:hypothetical protein